MWAQNAISNNAGTYYYDYNAAGAQTGVVRPGDDFWTGTSGLPNTSGTTATNNIYQAADARPVVLNRPFRSVGELGYAFRDMPYKSLDLSSSVSVDAALLDFFTTDTAQTRLAAGKVDLNTRQTQVLQAVLNGSFRVGDPSGQVALGSAAALPFFPPACPSSYLRTFAAGLSVEDLPVRCWRSSSIISPMVFANPLRWPCPCSGGCRRCAGARWRGRRVPRG